MYFRNMLKIKVPSVLVLLRARVLKVLASGRKRTGRRAFSHLRRVIFLALFVVLFALHLVFQMSDNMEQMGDVFAELPPIPSNRTGDRPGVTIWTPRTSRACTGEWNSVPAGGDGPEPYVMIRDVLLDRRHASVAEFRTVYGREHGGGSLFKNNVPPFVRIVFYVSVHLSVRLNSPGRKDKAGTQLGPSVRLVSDEIDGGSTAARAFLERDVEAHVDYVIHSTHFRVRDGTYKAGTMTAKTKDGMRISEWQVVLSLRGRDGENVMNAQQWEENVRMVARLGAKLSLKLPLLRYDGKVLDYEPTMRLECITGWEELGALPAVLNRAERPENCNSARGGVAVLGSPLHGKKKKTNIRDVAHFAARSLLGPLRFQAVVVTIVPERSLFEIHDVCQDNTTCIAQFEGENTNLLQTVANMTEHELSILGVPRSVFPNIILVPFCRFGSNYDGKERGSPCAASFWSGQHQNNYFGYTLVSPYFKWVAALDLDEFFAPNVHNRGIIRSGPRYTASKAFDKYSFWTDGALRLSWLNFHFRTLNENRGLTKDVMRSSRIPLLQRSQKMSETFCYTSRRIANGKIAGYYYGRTHLASALDFRYEPLCI